MFGFLIIYFTAFNVINKSYRQVLTTVNNAQLLLKLEILDKFRYYAKKLATLSGSYQFFRNRSSHDLEPQSINIMMLAP